MQVSLCNQKVETALGLDQLHGGLHPEFMTREFANHVARKVVSVVICHNKNVITFWQGVQRRERGKLRNKPTEEGKGTGSIECPE